MGTRELAELLFKCDATTAGLIAPVRFKKTYQMLLDNPRATLEWDE